MDFFFSFLFIICFVWRNDQRENSVALLELVTCQPCSRPAPNLSLQLWCGGGGGGEAAAGQVRYPLSKAQQALCGEAALISHLPSVTQQISEVEGS